MPLMSMRTKRRAPQIPQELSPPPGPPPGPPRFAPPPGPPPDWPQWQTPGAPVPSSSTYSHSYPPNMSSLGKSTGRGATAHAPETRLPSRSDELKTISRASKAGKGKAQLLHESLVYAKPEDLKDNPLIEEFLDSCRRSQEQIASNIPWLTLEAERSRERSLEVEQTREELLLADLLASNEELLDVLKMHADLVEQGKRDLEKAQLRLRALEAITSFQPTASESAVTDRMFAIGDPHGLGSIPRHTAETLFEGANLPPDIMHQVWEIANVEGNDSYGKYCVAIAVRLVGYAQRGEIVNDKCVLTPGPVATIQGLEPRRVLSPPLPPRPPHVTIPSSSSLSPVPPTPPPKFDLKGLPPLTEQDRIKFMQIFHKSGPENGFLSGPKAREVLMKSRLPLPMLGEIWDLADLQRRGYLDAPSFTIAMYLIQACMSGQLSVVPPLLPPSLYAEASLSSPHAILDAHYGVDGASSPTAVAGPSTIHWAISPELQSTANTFFNVLDEHNKEYLDPDTAKAHFAQTGLPQDTLRQIWTLSDVDSNGRLSREEFAIAVLLIQASERGVPLPQSIPDSLIPAHLRRHPTSRPQPISTISSTMADLSLIDFDEPEQSAPMTMPIPVVDGHAIATANRTPPMPTPRTPLSPTASAIWPRRSNSIPLTPSASPPTSEIVPAGWTWDVTPTDKANSDKFFDTLDPFKQGFVEGDAAVGFMSRSKLPPPELAKIWDLADVDHDGRLTKMEFAVAMQLIRTKLSGKDIPDTLPPSLVPPATLPESNTIILTQAAQVAEPEELPSTHVVPPDDADAPRSNTPPPPYKAYDENAVETN